MANRFAAADLHLGHRGMIMFARPDGSPLRPEWGRVPTDDDPMSIEEADERVAAMDEAIVERWNATVRPKDIVEVLGDVVINRRHLPTLGRLNGRKRLRMGNHDIFTKKEAKDYWPYFEDISAYKVFPETGMIMSHVPVHPCQLEGRFKLNVHGHMHEKNVMIEEEGYPGSLVRDRRYFCTSLEQINYTPIAVDEILKRAA